MEIPIRTLVLQTRHWCQHRQVDLLPLLHPRTPPHPIPNHRLRPRRRRRRRRRAKLRHKTKISLKSIRSDHLDRNQRQPVRLSLRTKGPTHTELLPLPTLIPQVVRGVYQIDHSTSINRHRDKVHQLHHQSLSRLNHRDVNVNLESMCGKKLLAWRLK